MSKTILLCRKRCSHVVERWFRELTDKALRRGAFHSVPDLISAIEGYLATHNDEPTPLVWTGDSGIHPRKSRAQTSRTPSPQPKLRHTT
jgi:hypothetical protein